MVAYVNVARYQPLRGGTYLDLPPKLKNKKAVINVRNRDEQYLKWALRAALFPALLGKNPQRPDSYPVGEGEAKGGGGHEDERLCENQNLHNLTIFLVYDYGRLLSC